MSKTPRTDNAIITDNEYLMENIGLVDFVRASHARQLETELADKEKQLAEARAEIENLKWHVSEEQAKTRAALALNDRALELVNEARTDADHWKSECNALQRMAHEARAEIERKDKLIEQMCEALQWYKEQVSSCNRNGDAGELARDRLAKDVGKRAEAALVAERGG